MTADSKTHKAELIAVGALITGAKTFMSLLVAAGLGASGIIDTSTLQKAAIAGLAGTFSFVVDYGASWLQKHPVEP